MFAAITRTAATRRVLSQRTGYSLRCMASNANKGPGGPSSASPEPTTQTESPAPGQGSTPAPEPPHPLPDPPKPASASPETPLSSTVPSLDFDPSSQPSGGQEGAAGEGGRTGAKSSKGSLSSAEMRRRNMGRVMMALVGVGAGVYAWQLGNEWNQDELKDKKMTLETAPNTRWGRTKERFTDIFDYFNKPAWPELLPPPYPPPHQKPYTLLISLDDLLITSTWDRQHGWRTAKRPGVDYFLAYISQFYEVVIFTSQHYYTAMPILEKLDRYNFYVTHRLFRESTRSINGKIVKDLSYLNRDLNKVVALDTDPEKYALHPENSIVIPKWNGDPKDTGLIAMIPFLESIAIYKPQDVRPILNAYHGKNIPVEYAKKEAEAKAKHVEEWKNKKALSTSGFGSLLGFQQNPAARTESGIPPTYLELKRKEAQMQYQEEQKYIQANKDELERLLKQEQDMMAGDVPSSLLEAFDQFRGVSPQKKQGELDGTKADPATAAGAAPAGVTSPPPPAATKA